MFSILPREVLINVCSMRVDVFHVCDPYSFSCFTLELKYAYLGGDCDVFGAPDQQKSMLSPTEENPAY